MLENKKGVWKIGSAAAVVLWAIQKQQKYNEPGLQAKQRVQRHLQVNIFCSCWVVYYEEELA